MKKHCRAQDIVCRLGGDEFVLFLPDMTREAAEESLRVLSAKLHIDYVKEKLEVMICIYGNCSFGRKGCHFSGLV